MSYPICKYFLLPLGDVSNVTYFERKRMRHIELSGKHGNGKFALVDKDDFNLLNSMKWHFTTGGYAVTGVGVRPNRKKIFMHRLIMSPPDGFIVDHKNGDTLDNRKPNLRICTVSQNTINSKKSSNKSSSFKGVSKMPQWRASIGRKTIGYFNTEEEAARAYDKEASELYGEYAKLNFPIDQ